MRPPARRVRSRPAFLRALGRHDPPSIVSVNGERCDLVEVMKHDSWAATALYQGIGGKIVIKFHRQQPLFFVPTVWLGRWLARRETRALRILHGIQGIPTESGLVNVNGRHLLSAAAHVYLEGHPLHIDERPNDTFFSRLQEMIEAMHQRGLAYCDLNKRENVIVTEEGGPALVDFQLHFAPPRWARRIPPVSWFFRMLQAADVFHVRKHLLWHRPDLVSSEFGNLDQFRPRAVRVWSSITRPAILFRRRLLVWLGIREGRGLSLSELEPEKAARLTLERKANDPAARVPGEEIPRDNR